MYHQLIRRIEAHICIAFAACKIYKELERQPKKMKTGQSPEQVIDLLKTIYSVGFETPYSTKKYKRLILKTIEQKELVSLFNLHFLTWVPHCTRQENDAHEPVNHQKNIFKLSFKPELQKNKTYL